MANLKILILMVVVISLPTLSRAQEITSVKGSKIYVESESPLEVGTQLDVLGADGRMGTVEIVKVKGSKALAKVVDGEVKAGGKLKARKGDSIKAETKKKEGLGKRFRFGVLGGVAMPSQTIKLTHATLGNETITPSGTSFNVGAIFDLTLTRLLSARVIVAMDKFVTSTTSRLGLCNKGTSTSCTSDITFLLLEPWAKINLVKNPKFGLFIGFGGQLMIPLSITTTTLNPDYVQTSFAMAPGIGADITLGKIVIPLQLEYAFLPSTEDLKTNILRIRTGLMF
ncbi:MAG: hypothetical protein K2X47_13405 [Bdellovibrionales bacterium]|nr:hypothetical protein [Bdellovibrionales bacterium]